MLIQQGRISDIDVRTGTNERGPWEMITYFVQDKRQTHEVQLSYNWPGERPRVGDVLDLEVTVEAVRRGNGPAMLRITAVRPVVSASRAEVVES